jgi:hypothetical protein
MSISHETRSKKAMRYNPRKSLERWIDEMSEQYGVSREEIANLAIVKLEKERIEREENGTRVS